MPGTRDHGGRVGTRRVFLVAALCCCASLSLVYPTNTQDVSRLGLTDSLVSYASLRIDRWVTPTGDKALFAGHWYSDKAPGQAMLAVPAYVALAAAHAVRPAAGPWQRSWTLWLLRVLTGGLGYFVLLLLVGWAAETLERGTGPLSAVAVGVGTFALGLAATTFSHLDAAAVGFLALLLLAQSRSRDGTAARWRIAAAGLAVGGAVLFDYLAVLIAGVLVVYLAATTRSVRRVALFLLGGLPAAAALGVYNRLAFGSPFHLSYRYVTGFNEREQRLGFFGMRFPRLGYVQEILISRHGLLLTSPVIVVAACGLVLLWRARERRAEVGVCLAVVSAFFVYTAGYFDPIGGRSPGPRFLGAALPFAAMGLPALARRRPRAVALLTALSIAGAVADGVRWAWLTDTSTWLFIQLNPAIAGALVALPALAALAGAVWYQHACDRIPNELHAEHPGPSALA